jgi:nucleoside-diphosphate-sugar epimerase
MGNTGIFITGATGSAGSYVVEELARRGIPVTALVRAETAIAGRRTVVGDLANLGNAAQAVEAADGIVHMGSPRSFDGDVTHADFEWTGHLIDLWRRGPFIYLSSTTIHGVPQGPLNESSPIVTKNWYDAGKYRNEVQLAAAAEKGTRGPGISLRPALIFSTNGRRHSRHFIGDFFTMCYRHHTAVFQSEEALETSGGSYIGGEDFGRAVADALTLKVSGPFTLAGDFQTWRTWIETINKYAGAKVEVVVRPGAELRPGEWRPPHSRTFLDSSAFKAQTGFEPRQSFAELVQEFADRDRLDAANK